MPHRWRRRLRPGRFPSSFTAASTRLKPDSSRASIGRAVISPAWSRSTSIPGRSGSMMHELVPTASTIALLLNPTNTVAETQTKDLQAAARTLGLELHVLHATTEREFEPAFADLMRLRAGGLVIGTDGFLVSSSEQLAALTLRRAVPAIFQYRAFVEAGGLMSYGGSVTDSYRLSGVYTGRILKGEKPADLPVQQATKVELIINLKTAKALGLTVPLPLLGRADEVIE